METRIGAPSFSFSSRDSSAGCQYLRSREPMGVPGPTRTSRSLSSRFSIGCPCCQKSLFVGHVRQGTLDQRLRRGIERGEDLRDLLARRRIDRKIRSAHLVEKGWIRHRRRESVAQRARAVGGKRRRRRDWLAELV